MRDHILKLGAGSRYDYGINARIYRGKALARIRCPFPRMAYWMRGIHQLIRENTGCLNLLNVRSFSHVAR
jgi:hypothetical protein